MGRKATDLSGMRFGFLTVLEREYEGRARKGRPFWRCVCDCGNTTVVSSNHLRKGQIKSCGCGQRRNDLSGKDFGRWSVLKRAEVVNGQQMWICRCECGTVRPVTHTSLVSGKSISCGCYQKEQLSKRLTTHGMTKTRLYNIYHDIKNRCSNPKNNRYKDYGGRGIFLCEEWYNDFSSFAKWSLSNGYKDELTIDRIDNDGPYSPLNCRWVGRDHQANNKRVTIYFEFLGVKKSLRQWVDFMGWNYDKYYARHYRGRDTFRRDEIFLIEQKIKRSD